MKSTANIKTLTSQYALAVITTFVNSWHADRTGERFFHITVPLLFAVFAYILAAATTKAGPRYLAMMLMVPGVYTGYVVALAWISNSLPRPPAKRAAALAFINAISNTSSIYASYMYSPSAGEFSRPSVEARKMLSFERRAKIRSCNECQLRHGRKLSLPSRISLKRILIILQAMAIVSAIILRLILANLNKKLDQVCSTPQFISLLLVHISEFLLSFPDRA